MKKFKNVVFRDRKGQPIPFSMDGVESELNTWAVFFIFARATPTDTMENARQSRLLLEALEKQDKADIIEIEDSTHDWLKDKAGPVCARAWRDNAEPIWEFIKEGFIKPKQPKE